MEYGRGTRGYAALKLREQGYKTVTSHIMYCTDLRSTCIYSTYNTRGMSNMQLKGGPHGAWAGACRTSSGRQVFKIAWNVWRNFAHLSARRAPIVQTFYISI